MSLSYVVDGETDLDSLLFNPIIDRVNGDAGPLANMRAGVANVLDYGAVGDGVTDDTAAIQVAIASGQKVYAPGDKTYGISDNLAFDVPIIGDGRERTIFKALSAEAGLTFSNQSYNYLGGFSFDGNSVATQGVVGLISHKSHWFDIYVHHTAGDSFRLHNVQNAQLDNIDVQWNTRGIWVDDGCGTCLFNAPAAANNDEFQLKVGSSGLYESDYTEPTAIMFALPMFEWIGVDPPDEAIATVVIEGGSRIVFDTGNVTSAARADSVRPTFKISVDAASSATNSSVYLRNCSLTGDPAYTVAFEVSDESYLHFWGGNSVIGADVGISVDGALAHVYGELPDQFDAIDTPFQLTGGASEGTSLANTIYPLGDFITSRSDAQVLRRIQNNGETGVRYFEYSNGYLGWGDGSGFSPDTLLHRGGAGLLTTDASFQLAGTYDKPLRLGDYRLWVNPGDGKLYIKSSAPASATDGTVVGSQ